MASNARKSSWCLALAAAALIALPSAASAQRFQFDGFKKNTWDIEHVRSVAEYVPRAAADRRRWLEHALDGTPAIFPNPPQRIEGTNAHRFKILKGLLHQRGCYPLALITGGDRH